MMVKKSYELRMNYSRLKKQLIWCIGTSLDEEAPYSDLVKMLARRAFVQVREDCKNLLQAAFDVDLDPNQQIQQALWFDDTLNDEMWGNSEEPFPAYTLGRDPNTLEVIHKD
jgi:hypothetical protein